jgi:ribonuclease HII
MRTRIQQIINLHPYGITTPDAAAQTMALLVKSGLDWHWDDLPSGSIPDLTSEEANALDTVSEQLWTVANKYFDEAYTDPDDEFTGEGIWEGLIDGLSTQDGIQAFRADTDENGMVYVAATGIIAKVKRDEWQEAYQEYDEMMQEEDREYSNFLLNWLGNQDRWFMGYED